MPLFVTPSDFKRKSKPVPARPEGVGSFTGKKTTPPDHEPPPEPDNRSEAELAATRIAKFIPSLVLVAYASLCNLVNSKDPATAAALRLTLFQIAFWICLAATPAYIAFFERKNPYRKLNVIVGTLAFPVWAYAFPCGWFVDIHKYDPVIAGFILIVFSLLTAVVPAPKLDGN